MEGYAKRDPIFPSFFLFSFYPFLHRFPLFFIYSMVPTCCRRLARFEAQGRKRDSHPVLRLGIPV